MGGMLRAEPLWVETFTGLRMGQFERLLKVVREQDGAVAVRGVCRWRTGFCWWPSITART